MLWPHKIVSWLIKGKKERSFSYITCILTTMRFVKVFETCIPFEVYIFISPYIRPEAVPCRDHKGRPSKFPGKLLSSNVIYIFLQIPPKIFIQPLQTFENKSTKSPARPPPPKSKILGSPLYKALEIYRPVTCQGSKKACWAFYITNISWRGLCRKVQYNLFELAYLSWCCVIVANTQFLIIWILLWAVGWCWVAYQRIAADQWNPVSIQRQIFLESWSSSNFSGMNYDKFYYWT